MGADPHQASWKKSSYSNGQNGACAEVAFAGPDVWVRDSKNPVGQAIGVDVVKFTEFVSAIKAGCFDL
ncbi:DUF397 domain-containing protein [Umezawaea sp. NPDC059074]|uniref:DUF397 domain-containing protein n=1 Tax=Umezawaea sp. NPDC059074 TaxID=3346716 RepID=UPI0036894484